MITHLTWSPLPFGRYEGKTLPQVVLRDADWFFWALGTRAFNSNGYCNLDAFCREI